MEIKIRMSNFDLKFKIRFKQKSKCEFYFLLFLKIENRQKDSCCKGSLGNVTDQRSGWAHKIFRKKTNRSSFFNFY